MVENVVVIGAGVYGAALAQRGARVVVVDAGSPSGGASGASFSWTNASSKRPRAYHDLGVAGMDAHRRLAEEVPNSDWYHNGGNLQWATGDEAEERLRGKVTDTLNFGYEARWLTRAEAVELEPAISPQELPADGIAYFPTEGWIEPARLVGHLLSFVRGRGGTLLTGDAVVGLDIGDGLVRAVRLASGHRLRADAVVNCAGPQAAAVAELAGLALPMRNTRGVLVCTSPVAVPVARVIHAPAVHLRPDGGGRLLLHTQAIDRAVRTSATGATSADPEAVTAILEASRALYPGLRDAEVESVRIGERPLPGDGLPVLGRAAVLPNFHFAVSHSGATLCLHAGGLVAAEVLGDDQDAALAAFRFDRFDQDARPEHRDRTAGRSTPRDTTGR